MVAEHSDLRFIQRNGVFFEDNEGARSPPLAALLCRPVTVSLARCSAHCARQCTGPR
jgi:hypothetical protein